MQVSLILCVRNGGAQLDFCLRHIAGLAGPADLEIILVDNHSDDGVTLAKLHALQEYCGFAVIVLQCAIRGNSAGRNAAIAVARGELLLFVDGDCYVDPDFALDWLEIFKTWGVGYASGRIRRYDTRYSSLGCNERADQEIIGPGKIMPRGFIQGSNMAFTLACLQAAGPFDIQFGAGTAFAGEEWEAALRASQLGFSGGYFPGPTVSHDHRRLAAHAKTRLLFYDYGAGAVYAKHLTGPNARQISRKFLGEIKSMRRNPRRLFAILHGFVRYYVQKFARQAEFTP